jgi:hypothetical protein
MEPYRKRLGKALVHLECPLAPKERRHLDSILRAVRLMYFPHVTPKADPSVEDLDTFREIAEMLIRNWRGPVSLD